MIRSNNIWRTVILLKPYQIKQYESRHNKSFKIMTPLLQIIILNNFKSKKYQLGEDESIMSIKYPFRRNALQNVVRNTRRQALMETFSSYTAKLPGSSYVMISLCPSCRLVSNQQLQEHFKKCLQFFFKRGKYNSDGNLFKSINIKNVLFPFDLQSWRLHMKQNFSLKGYSQFLYNKTDYFNKDLARSHWIVSHHYSLYNSKNLTVFKQDIINMLKIVRKFDFFLFFLRLFNNEGHTRKKFEAVSVKFIKSCELKSNESEKYLLFLVRQFGPENMKVILDDFQLIQKDYQ